MFSTQTLGMGGVKRPWDPPLPLSLCTHLLRTYYVPGAAKVQLGDVMPALSSGFRARGERCHCWGPVTKHPYHSPCDRRPLRDLREPVQRSPSAFGQHSQRHVGDLPPIAGCPRVLSGLDTDSLAGLKLLFCLLPPSLFLIKAADNDSQVMKPMHFKSIA